ncbi:3-dehydroquinate synthase [Vreelandella titanicae]|jgi:3-dehydroquinate synthase|uniref:3-dehydroquinate synthase n=1 Tax=Vreelandella titanicae BH1 TaxID=1204738 RepID=L9UCL5_9GAMM|nr:3-dehydroquinate synthase [Halomonas titanicae]ELY21943.1 3-dehydroquinate synthase AroB [Halomonas titanicae BH1]NVE90132.1 3-dehydroquinate synthase [Halomonas titanicae]|tara:strand:- start:66 stop:1184 length:1119 start_codon:yes stop_codon:yes gene_type:complete
MNSTASAQRTLHVALDERSYPIHIGTELIGRADMLTPYLAGQQVMVVTNETIAPLYLDKLCASLPDHLEVRTVILPDGEQYKTIEQVSRIWDALLEAGFNRRCTLIALGGGVIGDMVGYAAASYQRGVAFIQVPTTLLSQVDSSVGGKTGVNHPLGKNMIGAFWQPKAVLVDIDTLKSLPRRELSAGLAEVIKYGLIRDEAFLSWLEANMPALLDVEPEVVADAIARSCQIKADIVAEDETEQGVRALLNLGHTFGHAIEAHQGYGNWLHGEAVGAGMAMAATLSRRLGWLTDAALARSLAVIESAELPLAAPANMTSDDFLTRMRLDKKNIDTRLRLVLLNALGDACVSDATPVDVLRTLLDDYPRCPVEK